VVPSRRRERSSARRSRARRARRRIRPGDGPDIRRRRARPALAAGPPLVVSEFAAHVGENGGLFTPPQRGRFPASTTGRTASSPRRRREREDARRLHRGPRRPLRARSGRNAGQLRLLSVRLPAEVARERHRAEPRSAAQWDRSGNDRCERERRRRRSRSRRPPSDPPRRHEQGRPAGDAGGDAACSTPRRRRWRSCSTPHGSGEAPHRRVRRRRRIHALAGNKRGTHLSASLERLTEIADDSPTRIGCSATVEPLDEVADFLVGCERVAGEVGDPDGFAPRLRGRGRQVRPRVRSATPNAGGRPHPTPDSVVTDRFYDDALHGLIEDHENTLVFANSRSGAERTLRELRERFGYDESDSGCHHGSLGEAQRTRIEEGLKAGTLDVVTTSTSLELGIDMPHLDLVVQVGSPKSVAALLQRVGRAGHSPGETVEGGCSRSTATSWSSARRCSPAPRRGSSTACRSRGSCRRGRPTRLRDGDQSDPPRPGDPRSSRRAHPYREFGTGEYERLMRYLTGDYEGLAERNVYPKVWRDANDPPDGEHHHEEYPVGETLVGKRGRLARVIYMTNVGTIPDSFGCDVVTRDGEAVGTLDENYLDTLAPGDVFALGGERFAFRYRRGSKVYVDRTGERPTVPTWYAERLPLSADLAAEVLAFQADLLDRLERGGPPRSARGCASFRSTGTRCGRSLGPTTSRSRMRARRACRPRRGSPSRRCSTATRTSVGSTSTRRTAGGSTRGSRLVAAECAARTDADPTVAVADRGFSLALPLNRKVDVAGSSASWTPKRSARTSGRRCGDRPPPALLPDQRDALAHDPQAVQRGTRSRPPNSRCPRRRCYRSRRGSTTSR